MVTATKERLTKTGKKPRKKAHKRQRIRAAYDPSMPIKAYELAKSGMFGPDIRKACGVRDRHTWIKWKKLHPELRAAIKRGREYIENQGGESFKDYVYNRLSPKLQRIWDRLKQYSREQNPILKMELLLDQYGMKTRQQLFLHALTTSSFNLSAACRKVNVSMRLFNTWVRDDPNFAELVKEIDIHKGNFFEEALFKLVRKGDAPAIIFANKTFNKGRGYNEKIETSTTVNGQITHNVLNIDELQLPLEVRRQLLKAIREQAKPKALEHETSKDIQDAEFEVKELVETKA